MPRHLVDELLESLRRYRESLDHSGTDSSLTQDLLQHLARARRELARRTNSFRDAEVDQGDFLTSILAHSPDVISVLDRGGKFIYLSRAAPGRDPKDLVGADSRDFLSPEHRQLWHDALARAIETGTAQHLDLHSVGKYWWDSRLVPVEKDGQVTWLLAIARDISARKRVEADLELKQQQLEMALEASRMGLWNWSVPDDLVTWDAAAKRIFAWPVERDDIRYEDFLQRVHPSDRERVKSSVASAVESGEYPDLACRIVHPDGATRFILCKGKVVQDASGQTTRLVGGVLDITRSKQSEAQLQRSQKLEAIGQLAGGVAHDFNNLLVAILGNASLAKGASESDEREAMLDELIAAGNRAAALTRQLLVFSRRQPLDETVLDLNAMLGDTVKLLARLLPENIRLELGAGDNVPRVLGDRGQLEQLVVNLCVNARDAMPEGGQLSLKTARAELADANHDRPPWARPGGYAVIEVRDTGTGISPEVLEHVFEPFFTTKAEGTGLGLATAYGVSKRHGGFITVHSEPGQGAHFVVHLPESQKQDDATHEPHPLSAEGGSETILLAEDEEPVRAVVTRILERAGYRVIGAEDGAQAIELYRLHAKDIQLVLLDAVMPNKSGIEALTAILELAGRIPAVLSSGYSEAPRRIAEFEQEVAFVAKPYEPDTLLSVVRQQLDQFARRR